MTNSHQEGKYNINRSVINMVVFLNINFEVNNLIDN